MAPSSRFALSLKPSVAYLAPNFSALWKKQTTLPSLVLHPRWCQNRTDALAGLTFFLQKRE
jgi:hypothetical protein